MICLGISEDHFDAGATLTNGDQILFATNEERYTRRKNEGGWPHHALASLFDYTGVTPADIDRIYVCGLMTPPLPIRLFPFLHDLRFNAHRSKEDTWFKKFMDCVTFLTPVSHSSEDSWMRTIAQPLLPWVTRRRLPKALRSKPIYFIEHHECHAAGAWTLSGFDRCLAVTADGMGDGLSLTVSRCTAEDGIERLWFASSKDSFGLFFEAITEAFGFIPCRDEGKITGIAACGDPGAITEPDPFHLEQGRLQYVGPHGRAGVQWVNEHLLQNYRREDIAAWAQHLLERHLIEVTRWWLEETGMGNLAVAGGVYGNVKLNQRLHALDACKRLFVYPNMGDGGLSLGAVCAGEKLTPRPVADVFFGEDYPEDALRAAIQARGLDFERMDAPAERVGDLLAAGHIVARFDGRMEWGPRALGNRSILVRTSDRAVVGKLNDRLQRSDFMPFAPAVLAEDAEEYCLAVAPARHSAEFMTVCFDCTDRMKREHPAIVHVDGTARAQLVRADHNPGFHRILSRFKEHTGTGVILNTSFNIHEEPIVRTPEEGVAAFLNAHLDYLALGPFLVKCPDTPVKA
ncbi:MAG: carbamoyltransferase C-terminal domain-containing protein [Candidatus Hydrogenedentota bacterium]